MPVNSCVEQQAWIDSDIDTFWNKSCQWVSKYARGLVVLNKINKDRIAHL